MITETQPAQDTDRGIDLNRPEDALTLKRGILSFFDGDIGRTRFIDYFTSREVTEAADKLIKNNKAKNLRSQAQVIKRASELTPRVP